MLVLFGLTFVSLVVPLSISREEYRSCDLFSQHHYLPHSQFKCWPDADSQKPLTLD